MANKKSFTGYALFSEFSGLSRGVYHSEHDLKTDWSHNILNMTREEFDIYMQDTGLSIVTVEVKIIER